MDLARNNNGGSSWEFVAARIFLQSFNTSPSEATLALRTLLDPVSFKAYNLKSRSPGGLGDFDRYYDYCRKVLDRSQRQSIDSSSATPYEDNSTPASSPDDEITHFDDFVARRKEVRWTDIEGIAGLTEYRQRSTRSSKAEVLGYNDSDTEDGKSVSSRRSVHSAKGKKKISPSTLSALVPKLVARRTHVHTPKTARIIDPGELAHLFVDQSVIKALSPVSHIEQRLNLVKKLAILFYNEAAVLNSPEMLNMLHRKSNIHPSGIHVFVDLSNIVIGFTERIKSFRIQARQLSPQTRVKQPAFSFYSLSLVLERGRTVSRRVMAGSTSSALYHQKGHAVPAHVTEGESLGYEPNILERVLKARTISSQKKKGGVGTGYATTNYSSNSETQTNRAMKMQEQAVDELLQMKMLESLVDSERPSTMVLASGDGAEAEYSGGFLKTVERALEKGWKVEVAAFRDGLSHEYRSRELRKKWGNRLTIIELDNFAEEMLAVYTHRYETSTH